MSANAGSIGTGQQDNVASKPPSRRRFLTESSLLFGGTVASALSIESPVSASRSDEIRIGLVGCGVRGTSATLQALASDSNIKLIALCDLNHRRIASAMRAIKGRFPEKVDVNESQRFVGFDGFQRLLGCDIHVVLFATPPAFRPQHFEAAVDCGKHVFMEKPVATDPPVFDGFSNQTKLRKPRDCQSKWGCKGTISRTTDRSFQRFKMDILAIFSLLAFIGMDLLLDQRAECQIRANWNFNWRIGTASTG